MPLGLFARLPLAMLTVGVLTLVTAASSSYAIGGFAAGAVGLGSALGSPLLGFLADRLGQRPVLATAALLNTAAVVGLLMLVAATGEYSQPATTMVLAVSFGTGFSTPQVGPLARVRWMALTGRLPVPASGKVLDTALSYESTADEVTFVLGPALVGILATWLAPWLPLALAAALTLSLVTLFAVHPTAAAVPHGRPASATDPDDDRRPAGRLRVAVAVPVLAMVCMGTFFGSTQTAVSAFAGGFGTSELAGLLYAVLGLSSAAAALSAAYWPARISHPVRWIAVSALMAGLSLLLLLPTSLPMMALALLAVGVPVGPAMVTIFSIGSAVAPRRWLGTVMTALASGIVAGTAIGSSVAGSLAQQFGASAALLVPAAAAALLFVLGWAALLVVRRVA